MTLPPGAWCKCLTCVYCRNVFHHHSRSRQQSINVRTCIDPVHLVIDSNCEAHVYYCGNHWNNYECPNKISSVFSYIRYGTLLNYVSFYTAACIEERNRLCGSRGQIYHGWKLCLKLYKHRHLSFILTIWYDSKYTQWTSHEFRKWPTFK